MEQYSITGMSCAACSARIEKAVSKLNGVSGCSVNLLTNSMSVEGEATANEVIAAVKNAGYGATKKNAGKAEAHGSELNNENTLGDTETPKIAKRLIWSVIVLLPLMYISMGHSMLSFRVPQILTNIVAMGLTQLLLAAAVIVINQKFFINGVKGLVHAAPNMDTLVSLGSAASFGYSVYLLFTVIAQSGAEVSYYFDSSAMILTLITVGKLLEARSKGKTTDAIKSLMRLTPKTAIVIRNGKETEIPAESLLTGDIFIVKPGASIPCDGIVTEGVSSANEAALTGESIPVDKASGDTVSAATVNQSGFLKCRATRVGEDTTLSQIIKTVANASADKAPVAKAADKVSGVFVPVVLIIAAVTFAVWLFAGKDMGFAVSRAVSVLVISCPCALGLATPVAVMVGSGVGAKNGILYKTSAALEKTAKIKIAALDKTGTVTLGEPAVTDIYTANNVSKTELTELAYSLEAKSEHPLAGAICSYAEKNETKKFEVTDFTAVPGNGLTGKFNGKTAFGGNLSFISNKVKIPEEQKKIADSLADEGKTPLFFCTEKGFAGIIAVADIIKEDSEDGVKQLKEMGIRVIMLTGDNEKTARAIAKKAGITEVIADVLPNGKDEVIKKLQNEGSVAMVGDGINDAPALTRADVGIAIGAGADIAIDAADIVLVKSNLTDVPAAIKLGKKTLRNIHQNLFWAFFYNAVGIPLAAGVWIPIFGWTLNPMFGALAMSLSSFCVVMNALRLNLVKIYKQKNTQNKNKQPTLNNSEITRQTDLDNSEITRQTDLDNSQKIEKNILFDNEQNKKGEIKMTQIKLKVEGMMCPKCEAHVNESIKKNIDTVSVTSSHTKGETIIETNTAPNEQELIAAVKEAGYSVTEIQYL